MKVYSEIDKAKVNQEINLNIIPFIGFALKRLNTTYYINLLYNEHSIKENENEGKCQEK
jgi:hypothetical protein